MLQYRLRWTPVPGVEAYRIYRSDAPGEAYQFVDEVSSSEDPELWVDADMVPQHLQADGVPGNVELSWDPPRSLGAPFTFKITRLIQNQESFTPQTDAWWLQNTLPLGAQWTDTTGLSTTPWAYGSSVSFRVQADSGFAAPRFEGAVSPLQGHVLIWVYVPIDRRPQTLWIEFLTGEGWNKAIYLGLDKFFSQRKGAEAYYFGELPSPDVWAPLVIPLPRLRIGAVYGLAFGVGHEQDQAEAYFSSVLMTPQPVWTADVPHFGVKAFEVWRNGTLIGTTAQTSYTDTTAVDVRGFAAHALTPVFHFTDHPSGDGVTIRWTVPQEQGTVYHYEVVAVGYNEARSSPAQAQATITSKYAFVRIYADTSPITDNTPLLAEVSGTSYDHTGLTVDTAVYYRFDVYDPDGKRIHRVETTYQPSVSSRLDHFRLDYSPLA